MIEQRLGEREKKNLFPAFEKIKSIFDNGESFTGSFIASSQQALLDESQFIGEEATISDKAERAPRGPGRQKASRCSGLLVRNRPWRCHTGTMKLDKLPLKKDVLLIFNYTYNAVPIGERNWTCVQENKHILDTTLPVCDTEAKSPSVLAINYTVFKMTAHW